jgi:hypothetical protein
MTLQMKPKVLLLYQQHGIISMKVCKIMHEVRVIIHQEKIMKEVTTEKNQLLGLGTDKW